MFKSIGNHPKGQGFNSGQSLVPSASIRHGPGYCWNLSDPPAVGFLLNLDLEDHRLQSLHAAILAKTLRPSPM
jgi:hypothetical protein